MKLKLISFLSLILMHVSLNAQNGDADKKTFDSLFNLSPVLINSGESDSTKNTSYASTKIVKGFAIYPL